jgi:hypothetical protein
MSIHYANHGCQRDLFRSGFVSIISNAQVFAAAFGWAQMAHLVFRFVLLLGLLSMPQFCATGIAQVVDKQKLLEAQTFWANRDFDWYTKNIPFFDCPDPEITTTYYYRWELVTRHACYGSPNSGYSFSEFANRPFWSGAYGSIACPSGHQFNEIRWLRDPQYARDYARYWFFTPDAQPRRYSSWLADSVWGIHQAHPNKQFIIELLPELVKNYEAWQKRQWVAELGMFWQSGHDDGMELNINSRQTKDIVRGDQGFRPSFNTYMWADARAIARIAELAGDVETSERFSKRAKGIKQQVQERLWDPQRDFFFPMSARDEQDKDGNVVKAHTLTYQSGKFSGSRNGRELHGYVPWAFNLPDAGFEDAWKYLMDPEYFYAPFGPTTVERNDPMFVLQPGCCWWSGQSWPFATTQTLKAMANLLQNYKQDHVTRDDYLTLLHNFAVSHRKQGRPYIAEALNPDTGSWEGHDYPNRSEHYFHSGFIDLVITGLVGLKTDDDDRLTIDPLAPPTWDYFALDSVPYRGHLVTVCWDKTGKRYSLGAGLHVLVDGQSLAASPELKRITVAFPTALNVPMPSEVRFNYAVNNDGDYFPSFDASFVGEQSSLSMVCDGHYRYDLAPPNRWTTIGSNSDSDWIMIDFGMARPIDTVKLFLIDGDSNIVAPTSMRLEYWNEKSWQSIPNQRHDPKHPVGGRPNVVTFPQLAVSRLRIVCDHAADHPIGLTEIEAWGPGERPYRAPAPPAGNIAVNPRGEGYPKASASHHDVYGGVPAKANDGKIVYVPTPMNRWTSYGSKNKTDWLEIEFGQPETFGRIELHIYDDRGGVQPPANYSVEFLVGEQWKEISNLQRMPDKPKGGVKNTIKFDAVTASKLRVVFTHEGESRSGLTEIEIWRQ